MTTAIQIALGSNYIRPEGFGSECCATHHHNISYQIPQAFFFDFGDKLCKRSKLSVTVYQIRLHRAFLRFLRFSSKIKEKG